jgi:hypothetical protein
LDGLESALHNQLVLRQIVNEKGINTAKARKAELGRYVLRTNMDIAPCPTEFYFEILPLDVCQLCVQFRVLVSVVSPNICPSKTSSVPNVKAGLQTSKDIQTFATQTQTPSVIMAALRLIWILTPVQEVQYKNVYERRPHEHPGRCRSEPSKAVTKVHQKSMFE